VGFDDKQISLGKRETGAQAALPMWMEFVQQGMGGMPVLDFANVETLEKQAEEHHVRTDVPDTAPEDEAPSAPRPKPAVPANSPPTTTSTGLPPTPTP
jgi:penicillin-binding protein 1A